MVLFDRPIAWTDTETTSLCPEDAQVLEIAIVIPKGLGHEGMRWSTKVAPDDIAKAEPEALRINGYNEEDWRGAPSAPEAFAEMCKRLDNFRLIGGHNVGYDLSVIGCQMRRHGMGDLFRKLPYSTVDTKVLSFAALGDRIDAMSLHAICKELGVSNEGEHRALADVDRTIAVYDKLMAILLGRR